MDGNRLDVRGEQRASASAEGTRVDGHASLGSSLKRAVEKDRIVVDLFRERVQLGDSVEVRLVVRVESLLLRDAGSLHLLAKMREAPQEQLMVV
jgi:hypothetical protein